MPCKYLTLKGERNQSAREVVGTTTTVPQFVEVDEAAAGICPYAWLPEGLARQTEDTAAQHVGMCKKRTCSRM